MYFNLSGCEVYILLINSNSLASASFVNKLSRNFGDHGCCISDRKQDKRLVGDYSRSNCKFLAMCP